MEPEYRVGTSGFSYRHWRGVLYPEALPQAQWLEHYAGRFSTVELNSSFYRLPNATALEGWRRRTPAGFVFSVKASRLITHMRRLRDVGELVEQFTSRTRLLGDRLGPLLYQVAPDLERDEALLGDFLALLPGGALNVIEFRHASWYTDAIFDLLRRRNVALCVHDKGGSASPVVATADFTYVRFHGPTGHYSGAYSDEALRGWAGRIRGMAAGLKGVYVYFNNDIGGHAVHDAEALRALLR